MQKLFIALCLLLLSFGVSSYNVNFSPANKSATFRVPRIMPWDLPLKIVDKNAKPCVYCPGYPTLMWYRYDPVYPNWRDDPGGYATGAYCQYCTRIEQLRNTFGGYIFTMYWYPGLNPFEVGSGWPPDMNEVYIYSDMSY